MVEWKGILVNIAKSTFSHTWQHRSFFSACVCQFTCIFCLHVPLYLIFRVSFMLLPYHKGTELEIEKHSLFLANTEWLIELFFWSFFSILKMELVIFPCSWVVSLACKAFNSWRRQRNKALFLLVFCSVFQINEVNAQINQLIEKRMSKYEPIDSKFSMYRQQVRRNKAFFK